VFEAGCIDLEADVGPALAELRQRRRNLDAGEVAWNGDAQHLLGRRRTVELRDLIVDREHPARVGDDHLAARRQAHARRALVEQLVAEQELQPFDLRAHPRLRDAERLRRFGETAMIDYGYKRA